RLSDVLALYFPLREKEIIQKIEFLAEMIGYAMEDKYGYLGELGIDLGIDVNGKVWVIEVNGRPLKVSFNLLRDKTVSKVIHKNPITLGFSLTGFNIMPKFRALPPQIFSSLYTFKPAPQDWVVSTQAPTGKLLFLNPSQKSDFKFRAGQKVHLQIGFSSIEVEIAIQTLDSRANTMFLSQEALIELPYYHGEKISLIAASDRQLILQPTVGMTISHEPDPFYDEIYEMKKSVLMALEKGVFFFYFCLDQIDWDREEVCSQVYGRPLVYAEFLVRRFYQN
ncbi:MAG: YheC/YheD family protein, partial [Desulfitobacterium sp.]|nr:YheC/YheD family protein [Desulfitobacterium sp.]